MDDIGSSLREEILNANVSMFSTFHVQPSALASELVPLDLDVTPMDNSKTHKEGVSHTYCILNSATETCDARSRWSSMRELHFFITIS